MPNFLRMLIDPLTDAPSRVTRKLGDFIDDPIQGDRGFVRPFIAGALEGAGDLVSSATSPTSLLMSAVGVNPAIQRMMRVGKLRRALQGTDKPIRGLTAENATWQPRGGTSGLHPLRIEERARFGYDVPNNPRAQELERVRRMIEEAYLRGEITQ